MPERGVKKRKKARNKRRKREIKDYYNEIIKQSYCMDHPVFICYIC